MFKGFYPFCFKVLPLSILLLLSRSSNLAGQVTALDSFITHQMIAQHVPGVAVIIVKKGMPLWSHGYGWANIENEIPVTASTDFMLASVSKTITGVAMMKVYENGGFHLDDNINHYLPFTVVNPNYPNDTITFRELLTHTSSLKDNWEVLSGIYVKGDSPVPLGDFMRDYFSTDRKYYNAKQNFYNFPPQTKYDYCNEGVALCGYLVETITGIPFDQYCDDSIFIPLGMDQTSWHLAGLDTSNIAVPYHYSNHKYHPIAQYGYPDYPDGELRTNVISLAKFLTMFMNYGTYNGVRILDSSTVALMKTIQFPSIEPTQGLIWYTSLLDGRKLWGHNGGDSGVSTDMHFSDGDTTGVIVLTNGEGYNDGFLIALFDYAEGLEPVATNSFFSFQNKNLLNVFPNPAHESIFISCNEKCNEYLLLEMYDLFGRKKISEQIWGAGDEMIDVSKWQDELYFVKVSGENFYGVQKIMVK